MKMLKNLKDYLKSNKYSSDIFDIVIYGSALKGKRKPSDIDILVIFSNLSLKERLDFIQKLKLDLKKQFLDVVFDLQQILLSDLFLPSFLAKTGIFSEGYSIFTNGLFSQRIGFKSFKLFIYDISSLTHTQKIKFNYILSGRNKEGLISLCGGLRLAPGIVKIPLIHSLEFESILKKQNVSFSKKTILELN